MKVAIITYRPLGLVPTGSRRIMLDLAYGLHKRGIDATLYSIMRGGVGCPKIEGLDGVKCISFEEDGLRRVLLLPTRALTLSSREALLFLKLFSQFYVDRISGVYYGLAECIASEGYDVAILETIYTTFLGTLMDSTGISIVLRTHNVEAEYVSTLTYKRLKNIAYKTMYFVESNSLKTCDNVVTISMRDSRLLKKLYGVESTYLGPTLSTSRSCCESEDADVVKKYGFGCKDYFVFVGSLHKPNIDALNQILDTLSSRDLKINLVIAGNIGNYVERLKVTNDKIKSLGVVPDKVLKSLYCCSLGSIAPIVSGGGVPIKLVESLLYGVPTITSKRAMFILPGLVHGKNIVISENVGCMSEALKILARDEDMRERLSKGALELSERELGFEVTIDRYIRYLEGVKRFSNVQ